MICFFSYEQLATFVSIEYLEGDVGVVHGRRVLGSLGSGGLALLRCDHNVFRRASRALITALDERVVVLPVHVQQRLALLQSDDVLNARISVVAAETIEISRTIFVLTQENTTN